MSACFHSQIQRVLIGAGESIISAGRVGPRGVNLLFEIILQTLLGLLAVYFSILLLRSGRYWKILLGILLMAAGIVFTLTAGEILMAVFGYLPGVGAVKAALIGVFPYVIAGSFMAWLAYVFLAFYCRLGILGVLWGAFSSKPPSRSDHLEVAKNNALRDQFFWLIASVIVVLTGFLISLQAWLHQDLFAANMDVMIIAIVWAYVVPPLVIHTWLKKPDEILALKGMRSFQNLGGSISDYKELIAVMDDLHGEELKRQLDEMITEGLTRALLDQTVSEAQGAPKAETKKQA